MFDRFTAKGLIGYREIRDGRAGEMKIAYEAARHLSFPFIFAHKGDVYMMPEYSEGKELPLLKAVHFPDQWEKAKRWMTGKRLVDSILIKYEGQTYLLTQELTHDYFSDELTAYIMMGKDEWVVHPQNPIVKSVANSRLGGQIFQDNEKWIRVAQDCEGEYGKQIHFNQIIKLNEVKYEEKIIKSVSVKQIALRSEKEYCGIHTYGMNQKYEVIDLKNKRSVRIGNAVNVLYRIVNRLKKQKE